jgi:hypothetical protein
MTPQDREWLESEFQKVNQGIAAILAKQGIVEADVRAFRDAFIKSKDDPKLSGDELYREYSAKADEYYQTIETEPKRVLSHALGLIREHDRTPSGSK